MSPETQSGRGALARGFDLPEVPGTVWIPVAAVLAAAALWIAVRAHRQGRELLAVSVVGLLMVLVTPWTWTHYWVWFVPFFAMAAGGAWRSRRWWPGLAVVAGYLLVFSWQVGAGRSDIPLVGLVLLPDTFPPLARALAHTLYLALALLLLVLAAVRPGWLNPSDRKTSQPAGM
jgi:alpha-1,2-mannosyltransferase